MCEDEEFGKWECLVVGTWEIYKQTLSDAGRSMVVFFLLQKFNWSPLFRQYKYWRSL